MGTPLEPRNGGACRFFVFDATPATVARELR